MTRVRYNKVKVYRTLRWANWYCEKLRKLWPDRSFYVAVYQFGWAVWTTRQEGGGVPCAGL